MLAELIKQQIKSQGPVTFAQFMQMALYQPGCGYYTSAAPPMGRVGDFYTAPTVSPLFGAMLARQFHQLWQLAGCPAPWVLVEYGPGTGQLARDVVAALAARAPDLYAVLKYYLVEISDHFRQQQQSLLGAGDDGDKFKWVDGLEEIKSSGDHIHCVYANELVDAFPVHVVVQTESGLRELYVHHRGTSFEWQEGSLSSPELAAYFEMQQVVLAPGQRAEVNLQAREWLARVAANLAPGGVLLIIDYGSEAGEMYAPQRHHGTLRCFYRHRLGDDPLRHIGEQDITASVNFTALGIWGEQAGLKKLGLVTQPEFLINLGLLETLQEHRDYDTSVPVLEKANAIKRLVLPGGMGGLFKVLVLARDWQNETPLIGLKKFKRSQ